MSQYRGGAGEHLVHPHTSLTRLLVLNDEDMAYNADGEEPRTKAHGGGALDVPPPSVTSSFAQLEPVGVFWDIENCRVPPDKSAFALANKIRKRFFEGKREAEFVCVCDITKETRVVVDALNKAQVTVVHVSAVAKNAADDKLRQSLRRFAHTYHPPCTVVLISGDVNFAADLKDLRHAQNITITLVHNIQTSDALKVFANNLVLFDDLLQDLEPTHLQPPSKRCTVLVSGLPSRGDSNRITGMLGVMSDNCGGKVLFVDLPTGMARITYKSYESALKSSKRLTGEKICGSMITAVVEQDPPRAQTSPYHPSPHHPPVPCPPSGPLLPHPSHSMSGPQPRPPPQLFPPSFNNASFPALPLPYPVPSGMNYAPPPRTNPPSLLLGPFPPPHPIVRGPRPPRHPHTAPSHIPHTRPPFPPRGGAWSPGPPLLQQQAAPPLPGPQVHLLVNTRSGFPAQMEEVTERVMNICALASVKAKVVHMLWYSYSELHALLWLDILQSAIEQNDTVAELYKKGNVTVDIARAFAEHCSKAMEKSCQQQWKVEVCKWRDDEERDRFIRSRVIKMLIEIPGWWMMWITLRRKYQQCWKTSVSELDIKTACKGAVSILKNTAQGEQLVMISEFDPMVGVCHDATTEKTLKDNVVSLLSRQHSWKIKLLDIVKEYTDSFGSLPLPGVNGKPFLSVVGSIPEVEVEGNTLLTTFVTLKKTQTVQSATASAKSECKPSGANVLLSSDRLGLLINTGSGQPENLEGLRELVAETCLLANVITGRVAFLRYSYSELHIHLIVDFLQSAKAQNDEVAELHKRGLLSPDVVKMFGDVCCQAVQKVYQLKNLPWQVKVCCWEEDEESDREMRSRVIELLMQSPSKWMMWNDFRDLYLERFKTKIESVKSYKDAVVLLDSPPLENQAICLHELSPLTKLIQNEKALQTVMNNMVTLLGTLPDKKIPILSIVEAYNKLFGKLPLVKKKGKSLLDALKSQHGIEVTGDKLSNQVVALSDEQRPQPSLQASAEKTDSSSGTEIQGTNLKQHRSMPDSFMDEVTAILLNAGTQMLSLERLTQQYNKFFSSTSGKFSMAELTDALKKLPNIETVPSNKGFLNVRLLETSEAVQPSPPQPPTQPPAPPAPASDVDWSLICSEVHRILLCHREHAMTLAELVQRLKTEEDQAVPSSDNLHQYLEKANAKQQTFVIDYIQCSVPDSIVQLNIGECLNKLCSDLLHVFVCHAAVGHPLQWDIVLSSYATLCGHPLNPVVYGSQDFRGLMGHHDVIKSVLQFNQASGLCTLTNAGAKQVLSLLLAELLFTEGKVALCNLPHLYQDYFGVPLNLCGAIRFTDLMKHQLFSTTFEIHDDIIDLRRDARFAEQLRCLLSKNSGNVSLHQLSGPILTEFGMPGTPNVPELRDYCATVASHVVSCTRNDCLVWAPLAHPCPPRRGDSGSGGMMAPAVTTELVPSYPLIEPALLRQQSPGVLLPPEAGVAVSVQGLDVECVPSSSNRMNAERQFDSSELDRVLESLCSIKDLSTGELDVDKLDPILDYFVEVTNREVASYKLQKPIAKPRSKLACQFSGGTSD